MLESNAERVRKVLRAMPEIKNEQLYQVFPDIDKGQIRGIKADMIKTLKIEAYRKQQGTPATERIDPDDLDTELKIPKKQKPGTAKKLPDSAPEDDLPPPTNRKWKGEIWKIDQMGKLNWYRPSHLDVTYAHWYEVFYNNTYNFPNPTPLGQCHRQWGSLLDSGIKRLGLLCPRDHHKSSFINNGYTTYDICEHIGNWRGILNIAWDKDLTLANTLTIVQNLQYNPIIVDFYGGLIDLDRPNTSEKKYFQFQPKGSRPGLFTTAFKTGAITGTHPHLAMMDDIQDEMFTALLMDKFQRVVDIKILPAIGMDGRLIITGTIKGFDETNDGYLWLKTKPTFDIYRFPAVINENIPPIKDLSWTHDEIPVYDAYGKSKLDFKGKPLFRKQFKVTVKDRENYPTLFPEKYQIEDLMIKMLEMLDKGKSIDKFFSEYMLVGANPKGRFFDKERIKSMKGMNHPRFHDIHTFCDWIFKNRVPIYLWIDPGGEGDKSHGICMAVIAFYQGCYYLLDVVVVRAGLPVAAKTVAQLLEKWKVAIWGVEGNFSQAECYGRTLNRELKRLLTRDNKMIFYKPPVIRPNTDNKIQRIRDGFSSMIGIEGMESTFFVNEDATDYPQFTKEVREFGLDVKASQRHDFDILDSIVSSRIHLMGKGTNPIVASCH